MSNLDPELKRVIAAARQAEAGPLPACPPALATRVLAEVRARGSEVISNRLLGTLFLASAALAVVWVFVFLGNDAAGSDQAFNELAASMVTRFGR